MPDSGPQAGPERAESKGGGLRGVLPVGTTLRGYELKSILGQGAFGITYRARDLTLGRDVAIKEYLPTTLALREGRTTVLPRSPDHAEQFAWGRERFLEEARTLARLDRTPAIVRVHDFLEANGTAYMVMGVVEGETLNKHLLREGPLTPETVERLLFPLLDGLEEVHSIGFLHRDIKPANIMVDARGRPTLIDFGAARAAMAGRSTTMTAIFTPGYAAAEQYTSAELGPWTDIYGLAATLYHAITGKIPPSSIERIIRDTYEPLSELRPEGYALELLVGIDAGMTRNVENRPQSIAEWRHVLRTGEHQASAQEVTQIEHRPRRLSPRGRRGSGIALRGPALWASAAAVAILLAGGGYLAFTANAPTTINTAALSLSAEQLEQALAERRKADAFAAEKRQLEEEARQRAEADAEAKRQADWELEQAREARQKAEQELAELKARIGAQRQAPSSQSDQAAAREAEEAAQRKAEADAAVLRQAEEEAAKKAHAEAEAKRQAEETLARAETERQQAEQEARQKAEEEQAALRQASQEAQRKAVDGESVRRTEAERAKAEAERQKAEAERQKAEVQAKARHDAEMAEKALRLDQAGRERVQLALTSLGFDTRGTDGIFGPRSREMVSAWQKARNQPVTGFMTAAQHEALLREAAPKLAKHDEQKKAEEEAKAGVALALPPPAPAGWSAAQPSAAQPGNTAFDGTYSGDARNAAGFYGSGKNVVFTLHVANGRGAGAISAPACNAGQFSVSVSPNGAIVGEGYTDCALAGNFYQGSFKVSGKFAHGATQLAFQFERGNVLRTTLRPGGGASPPAPASSNAQSPSASAMNPATTRYDGTYSGDTSVSPGFTGSHVRITASLQVASGRGTGTTTSPGCGPSQFTVTVSPTGNIVGSGYYNCFAGAGITGPLKIEGAFEDKAPRLSFHAERGTFAVTFRRGAAPSAALPSPDGLWRGMYACSAVSSNATHPKFSIDLNLRVTNGISSGGGVLESTKYAGTLNIEVSVNPPNVTVTRTYKSVVGNTPTRKSSMLGQYGGASIRANGRQEFEGSYGGVYDCALTLARVP